MAHHAQDRSHSPLRGRGVYTNLVLTAIAGLLGLHVLGAGGQGQPVGPQAALAQGGSLGEGDGGLANALQQRKDMIVELRAINMRLDRLEGKLAQGINVKVTDMPALKLPPELLAAARPAGRTGGNAGATSPAGGTSGMAPPLPASGAPVPRPARPNP